MSPLAHNASPKRQQEEMLAFTSEYRVTHVRWWVKAGSSRNIDDSVGTALVTSKKPSSVSFLVWWLVLFAGQAEE